MATAGETKALNQLIKSFEEASVSSKELERVIKNFAEMTNEFREVLYIVDEKISAKEVAELSQEAIEKLDKVKSYNELEMLEMLEKVVSKQVKDQVKGLQKQLVDHQKDSQTKLDQQLKKLTTSIKSSLSNQQPTQADNEKQQELLAALKRIESQTKNMAHPGQWTAPQANNEEVAKLRRYVSTLNQKLKKIEADYEYRIEALENEVEILRANQQNTEGNSIVDIDDEDLPF
ncbi:hypothetical protein [Litchfieldia alkalitelluris]|uniref:hypothetical protein n=1 Tax=Litchfieldia alkalitelluris TaxID=304268 RepID=UPI000998AC9B|nr:hypothetical protein [Litchfieldia alkalitelluris]